MTHEELCELYLLRHHCSYIRATLYVETDGGWYFWRHHEVGSIVGAGYNIHFEEIGSAFYRHERVLLQFAKAVEIALKFYQYDFMLRFTSYKSESESEGGIAMEFKVNPVKRFTIIPASRSVIETFERMRDEIDYKLIQLDGIEPGGF